MYNGNIAHLSDVNAPKEKQTVSMVSEFTEYFIRVMLQLDAPKGMLSSAEFDNVAAVLLLIEELILESCDNEKKEIKHTLCGTSDVAKSASLLMEHLNDEGIYEYNVIIVLFQNPCTRQIFSEQVYFITNRGARFARLLLYPIQLSHHTSTCTHAIKVL